MRINLEPNVLERYLQTELDSENLDAIVNGVYLSKPIDEKKMASLLKAQDPSNAYRSYFLPFMDEDEKEAFASIFMGFGLDEIEKTEVNEILENPYYKKLLAADRFKDGKIELSSVSLLPYSLFLNKDKGIDERNPVNEKTYLSYVDKKVDIPCLKENGYVWMSLLPHELHTMEKPIEEASGDVLVYGAGLGYFAFMAANKENVSSVTIVEKDKKILSLFKKRLLPLFDHPEKVTLVEADALEFSKREEKHYSYCFVDIYHGEVDGFPLYSKLRALEGNADITSYWIEKALLCYFRRHVMVLMEELFFYQYGDSDYESVDDPSAKLLSLLYHATKEDTISSEEDLIYYLSDNHLRELAAKLGY